MGQLLTLIRPHPQDWHEVQPATESLASSLAGLGLFALPPSPDLLSLDVYTAYPLSSWRFESNCQSTTVARLMRSMTRCWTASSK